jgi:ABC-type nickel/cobalt efflux system permease component RcnA
VKETGPRTPPPPLEANDQLVTGVVAAGWAVALIVLLIVRDRLPADARWWIWTCVAGLAMGLFGLWYVPRLKRGRARAAARRAEGQSDSGSNTVSSTDTPGKSKS